MHFLETKLALEKIQLDMEVLTESMMGAEDLLSAHHEDQVFRKTDYDPPQQRKCCRCGFSEVWALFADNMDMPTGSRKRTRNNLR